MIDMGGIEHYPKQRKKGRGAKLWILAVVFAVIAAAVYYYLFNDEQQVVQKPKTNLIVIKVPESALDKGKTKGVSIPIKLNTTTHSETQAREVLENLDEINQIHKKNQ